MDTLILNLAPITKMIQRESEFSKKNRRSRGRSFIGPTFIGPGTHSGHIQKKMKLFCGTKSVSDSEIDVDDVRCWRRNILATDLSRFCR